MCANAFRPGIAQVSVIPFRETPFSSASSNGMGAEGRDRDAVQCRRFPWTVALESLPQVDAGRSVALIGDR